MVGVQAEPEAVWETAFYVMEGDAIIMWAFSVEKVSWCATGCDSSLSSSHAVPAWWCSSRRGSSSEDSGLA